MLPSFSRLFFAVSAALCFYASARATDLLIENVTIVSPERTQPSVTQFVLIRDGRIAQISAKPLPAAKNATKLNGAGKFLTPGIMDAHVHLTTPPGLPMGTDDPSFAPLIDAFNKQQPRSYLYFGVTQVLDTAHVRNGLEIFEAQPQHPDLFQCGARLCWMAIQLFSSIPAFATRSLPTTSSNRQTQRHIHCRQAPGKLITRQKPS
jgi:hypothetical protein